MTLAEAMVEAKARGDGADTEMRLYWEGVHACLKAWELEADEGYDDWEGLNSLFTPPYLTDCDPGDETP